MEIDLGGIDARVSDRLLGGGDAEMNEGIALPGFLWLEVFLDVEVADFAAEARRKGAHVEPRDGCDAAPAFGNVRPGLGDGVARRRNHTEPRDDNSSLGHGKTPGAFWGKRPGAVIAGLLSGVALAGIDVVDGLLNGRDL